LSYRDAKELLADRGLDISYETIRRWVRKFGPQFARRLRDKVGEFSEILGGGCEVELVARPFKATTIVSLRRADMLVRKCRPCPSARTSGSGPAGLDGIPWPDSLGKLGASRRRNFPGLQGVLPEPRAIEGSEVISTS
jgi:hypothetical protein